MQRLSKLSDWIAQCLPTIRDNIESIIRLSKLFSNDSANDLIGCDCFDWYLQQSLKSCVGRQVGGCRIDLEVGSRVKCKVDYLDS